MEVNNITLLEEIKNEESSLINIRHDLHRIPETAHKEFKTTAYIKNMLKQTDVEIFDIGLETGVCALLRGKNEGPTIALRADIDALPMQETSGVEFVSEHPGTAHSCGHDTHTSALIYAAQYLSRHRDLLCGNVWFYFQPAEETLTGARKMIEAGCMEIDPKPESVLCFHTFPPLPVGKYGVIRGGANSSCDNLKITISSSGGHASCPQKCGDPIVTSAALITQLQTCVSRDNNPMMPAVLSFGSIHGGAAPNTIPQSIVIEGTIRTVYPESRNTIKESIKRICKHVGGAMRTCVEVEFMEDTAVPSAINDNSIVDRAENAIKKLFGSEAISIMPFPSTGSEDFALFAEKLPSAIIRFGTNDNSNPATLLGVHNPGVQFDDRSLLYAASLFCQYVLDYLSVKQQ